MTIWTRDTIGKASQAAADTYNAKSDTNHVTVVQQESKQFNNQLALALSAKNALDMVYIDCVMAPYFMSIKGFNRYYGQI